MNFGRVALFVCVAMLASACEAKVNRSSSQAVSAGDSGTAGGSGGSSGGTGGTTTSGGSGTPTPPPPVKVYKSFAYVSAFAGLKSYKADVSTGALAAITDVPAVSSISAAVDPLGKYVWVIDFSTSQEKLRTYSIAPTTGVLSLVGSVNIPGFFSYRLASDPTGTFLFSSNNDSQNVTSYRVDRATGLVSVVNSVSTSVSSATFTDIGVHPTGKYVYVAGQNQIHTFNVAATGALSLATDTAITGGQMAMIHTGTAHYIYAGGKVFTVDPVTGALGTGVNTAGVDLLAYANGYVYTAVSNVVTGYQVGANGVLTQVTQVTSNNPGSTGALFKHLNVSPDGKTLYVNSDGSGNGNYIHQFTINPANGSLTDKGIPIQLVSNQQLNSIWPIRIEQP